MNILLIGNPIAGTGKSQRVSHELAVLLNDRGHKVETFFTRQAGDARRRAELVRDTLDVIVTVGGDGILNEVINGLPSLDQIPLLPVPTGTANMLAREINIPARPLSLISVIEQRTVRRLDVGYAGERRFLMVASAGFDAEVARYVAEHRGPKLGYQRYATPILHPLRSYCPIPLSVELDGKERYVVEHVMAIKVRYYGGIFQFTSSASLDSGLFEVLMLEKATKSHIMTYAASGLFGNPHIVPGLIRRTAHQIKITSESMVPTQVDGEFLGYTPVEIRLAPRLLPVLVP